MKLHLTLAELEAIEQALGAEIGRAGLDVILHALEGKAQEPPTDWVQVTWQDARRLGSLHRKLREAVQQAKEAAQVAATVALPASPRVQQAVAAVQEWHRAYGEWPSFPTSIPEVLALTGEDIDEAVDGGFLMVRNAPGSLSRLLAANGNGNGCSYDGLSLPILPEP
jgi:hypothetical protein